MVVYMRKCYKQKKLFKAKLRQCKFTKETNKADAMAEALNSEIRQAFVKKSHTLQSHSLASYVDNVSGTAAITEMWKNKFSKLLNEQNVSDADETFLDKASNNYRV